MNSIFFSLISPHKETRLVLEAAKALPHMSFYFYGRIEESFSEEFFTAVEATGNVGHHGVFDSVGGDVLMELSKYDLRLFPTLCPNEGVPGVIAETKMAGVPTIASDRSYNAELITDGVNGVLMQSNASSELPTPFSSNVRASCELVGFRALSLHGS